MNKKLLYLLLAILLEKVKPFKNIHPIPTNETCPTKPPKKQGGKNIARLHRAIATILTTNSSLKSYLKSAQFINNKK